jgi:hypothetical protein
MFYLSCGISLWLFWDVDDGLLCFGDVGEWEFCQGEEIITITQYVVGCH